MLVLEDIKGILDGKVQKLMTLWNKRCRYMAPLLIQITSASIFPPSSDPACSNQKGGRRCIFVNFFPNSLAIFLMQTPFFLPLLLPHAIAIMMLFCLILVPPFFTAINVNSILQCLVHLQTLLFFAWRNFFFHRYLQTLSYCVATSCWPHSSPYWTVLSLRCSTR